MRDGVALQSAAFQSLLNPPLDVNSQIECNEWNVAINAALDALPSFGWPVLRTADSAASKRSNASKTLVGQHGDAIDCSRWYIEPVDWPGGGMGGKSRFR